jgi:hypothetical protein
MPSTRHGRSLARSAVQLLCFCIPVNFAFPVWTCDPAARDSGCAPLLAFELSPFLKVISTDLRLCRLDRVHAFRHSRCAPQSTGDGH